MEAKGLSIEEQVGKKLREVGNELCQEFCKYPDEYFSLYDDGEEAEERLAIEKCEICPLTRMGVWK